MCIVVLVTVFFRLLYRSLVTTVVRVTSDMFIRDRGACNRAEISKIHKNHGKYPVISSNDVFFIIIFLEKRDDNKEYRHYYNINLDNAQSHLNNKNIKRIIQNKKTTISHLSNFHQTIIQ